jgi:hypothetical protein
VERWCCRSGGAQHRPVRRFARHRLDVDSSGPFDEVVADTRGVRIAIQDEDMARLSPFVHPHLGVRGTYTFALADLAAGAMRDLRDADANADEF